MRTYPDETIFPVGFDEDNLMKGTHGGVMRHELESNSRQTCRKWFPYIKALAAKHDLRAVGSAMRSGLTPNSSWFPFRSLLPGPRMIPPAGTTSPKTPEAVSDHLG